MPTRLGQRAQERLQRQAMGDFSETAGPNISKYQAVQPEAAMYGVFQPGYAQTLARDSGNPVVNMLNTVTLQNRAEIEAREYAKQLAAANAVQERLQNNAGRYMLEGEVQKGYLPGVELGIPDPGAVVDDGSGHYIVKRDPIASNIAAEEQLNAGVASRLKDTGAGVKDLRDSGYMIEPGYIGSAIAPAGQPSPAPVTENLVTVQTDSGPIQMDPNEVNDYITALAAGDRAKAAMIAAEASKIRASKAGSGGAKTVVQYGADGRPIVTTITNPGVDYSEPPDLGYEPNPKADGEGSAPSAKPTASGPKLDPQFKIGMAVPLGNQFGTVTSTKRSAEHNRKVGGVSNSHHLSGHAIDIARNKGVSHKEIEAAYKNAGFKLVESLDEGNHSHFAFASGPDGKPAQAQRKPVPGGTQRVLQLAASKGYRTRIVPAGVEVIFPSGKTAVYNDQGKVVGN